MGLLSCFVSIKAIYLTVQKVIWFKFVFWRVIFHYSSARYLLSAYNKSFIEPDSTRMYLNKQDARLPWFWLRDHYLGNYQVY